MLIKKILGPVALTIGLTFGLASAAHASLIGDTVSASLVSSFGPLLVEPASGSAVVTDPGAEFVFYEEPGGTRLNRLEVDRLSSYLSPSSSIYFLESLP